MNKNLIWIIAFLLGLFIIISIFILNNFITKENFEDNINNDDTTNYVYDNNNIENTDNNYIETPENNNNFETPENKNIENIEVENNINDNIISTGTSLDIMNQMKNILASSKNENLIESVIPNTDISSTTKTEDLNKEIEKDIPHSKCYSNFRSTNIFNHGNDLYDVPYIQNTLMHINTYNEKFPKISKSNGKNPLIWYDEVNNKNDIPGIHEENNRKWFDISEPITDKKIIKYEDTISSIDLNQIQLSGPIAIKFSNNKNNNLEPFSIFFITKIKNLGKQMGNNGKEIFSSLFELPLATIIDESGLNDDTDPNSKYIGGIISLMIKEESDINKKTCNVTIRVRFGDQPYDWKGIDNKLILNKNILIGLIYDGNNIRIILDNLAKNFNITEKQKTYKKLVLGSTQFIINKKRKLEDNINMELFSFIYYNKVFTDRDIDLYIKYNNYHINKLHNLKESNEFIKIELDKCQKENSTKIDHLQNKLINKDNELDKLNKEYINLLKKIGKQPEHTQIYKFDKTYEKKRDKNEIDDIATWGQHLNDTKNILFNDNNNWNMSGGKNMKKNQIIEVPEEENYEIDKTYEKKRDKNEIDNIATWGQHLNDKKKKLIKKKKEVSKEQYYGIDENLQERIAIEKKIELDNLKKTRQTKYKN